MMKRLQFTVMASILTLAISSVAFGGNIGGLRTASTGNIGGLKASTGNIGGLRSTSGNIGGLSSNIDTDVKAELFGNIGGLIRIVLSTTLVW